MIAGEHAVEIRRRLGLLSSAVAADPFLSAVGAAEPSHRFLGNSTQAVYRRQVAFLAQILPLYTGRKPDGLSVLDWGCGKGQITYLLRKEHFVVVPSDLASDASDSAFGQPTPLLREMGSVAVPLVDTVKLPFA